MDKPNPAFRIHFVALYSRHPGKRASPPSFVMRSLTPHPTLFPTMHGIRRLRLSSTVCLPRVPPVMPASMLLTTVGSNRCPCGSVLRLLLHPPQTTNTDEVRDARRGGGHVHTSNHGRRYILPPHAPGNEHFRPGQQQDAPDEGVPEVLAPCDEQVSRAALFDFLEYVTHCHIVETA